MTKIINIAENHIPLLKFLYPTHSIISAEGPTNRVILRKEIKSKMDKEIVMYKYTDSIIISTQIYDEFWNEEELSKQALTFMQQRLSSRRRVVPAFGKDTFTTDLIAFIFFETPPAEESEELLQLFEQYGSVNFIAKYAQLSTKHPVQVLNAAMNTFISRILVEDTTSLFYKKMQLKHREKLKRNFLQSYDNMKLRPRDDTGLSDVKFYMDLLA